MDFSKKRKRAARRMLRKINCMLRKMCYQGYRFEKSEQQLHYEQAWYTAQLEYGKNILA